MSDYETDVEDILHLSDKGELFITKSGHLRICHGGYRVTKSFDEWVGERPKTMMGFKKSITGFNCMYCLDTGHRNNGYFSYPCGHCNPWGTEVRTIHPPGEKSKLLDDLIGSMKREGTRAKEDE